MYRNKICKLWASHAAGALASGALHTHAWRAWSRRLTPPRERSTRSHIETLIFYESGFNQNYYMLTSMLRIKTVLCSWFPWSKFMNYKCFDEINPARFLGWPCNLSTPHRSLGISLLWGPRNLTTCELEKHPISDVPLAEVEDVAAGFFFLSSSVQKTKVSVNARLLPHYSRA